MQTKSIYWITATVALRALSAFAAERVPDLAEGTVLLNKSAYPLKHACAYEATVDHDEAIAIA
jgi:hypothetical protein